MSLEKYGITLIYFPYFNRAKRRDSRVAQEKLVSSYSKRFIEIESIVSRCQFASTKWVFNIVIFS